MKIGFIGVGAMGQPMLANLVKHGHQLVAYDVIEAALAGAVKAGATRAAADDAARVRRVDLRLAPLAPRRPPRPRGTASW